MKVQKRCQRSSPFQMSQVKQSTIQQYKTVDMQNSLFDNKNNIQNAQKLLQLQLSDKQTPIIPPLQEQDFSNNVLNIGFIAQESKILLSDSQSVVSDCFSISAVSVIRSNPKGSPHILNNFEQQISGISGMDEWSQNSQISFTKKTFKRNKPEAFEDECEQIQNQYTKRRMNQGNKVVTNKAIQQGGYKLRSKSKQRVVQEQSSSNEDIRQILVNMKQQGKGANITKNKINQK